MKLMPALSHQEKVSGKPSTGPDRSLKKRLR